MTANPFTRLAGKQAGRPIVAAILFAFAAAGFAAPAAAQTATAPATTAPPQVSPGSLLLAKQIVDAKDVKGVFQPIIRGIVTKARNSFLQTNFMYEKDIDQAAIDVEKQYEPRVNELVDASAHFYASHFTEQELRDLLTFYTSPLGKKALAEEPKILDQSMVYAGTWAESLSTEIVAAMRAELKKRGHDM